MARLPYFKLIKRNPFYFYRLPGEKELHSTYATSKRKAERYVVNLLRKRMGITTQDKSLREYAEPFFVWNKCPHIKSLFGRGEPVEPKSVKRQRALLEKYLFADTLAEKDLSSISEKDIEAYLNRLAEKPDVAKELRSALEIIFEEACLRGDLSFNPLSPSR
jgi:hypothetical protein